MLEGFVVDYVDHGIAELILAFRQIRSRSIGLVHSSTVGNLGTRVHHPHVCRRCVRPAARWADASQGRPATLALDH
eukprot:COSAG02_NODE_1742_length_11105_cov_11.079956_6_plen_76_part_00